MLNFLKAFWKIALLTFGFYYQFNLQATHIIGGALFYEKISDSTYTITLKMYRDCSPGTANLPNSAVITVRGEQGATFCPSKDVTLPRISLTVLNPVVDTCVINPGVCVQEGIYQGTFNIFPGNSGYHLYYQTCCRNASLNNVVNPLNSGESFYAYIPPQQIITPKTAIWFEAFSLANGTTVDNGTTSWSSNYTAPPGYNQVTNCRYEASHTSSPGATWSSQNINIAAQTGGVQLKAALFNSGASLENTDSILVYYSLNGGPDVLFENNGSFGGSFPNGTIASSAILTGTTVRIKIRTISNSNDEFYAFDNVGVYINPTDTFVIGDNSNPVFVNFPPIFVCVQETLQFDHSAFDQDGDSLVYSLYRPFDGKLTSQAGYASFVPTFNNSDSILFVGVNYTAGYNAQQPLGAGGLSINTQTGMLTITPPSTGQYVVGIMVQEWRNGVMIGYSVRDFQFNVLYCPPLAQAIINDSINCADSTVYFESDMTADSYSWNFGDPSTLADVSNSKNPSYQYPDTGTYLVTLIINVGTPCADTMYKNVVVKWHLPDFSFTTPTCTDDTIVFTDLSTHSLNTSIANWFWNFGDGNTSTLQNPTHSYPTTGNYTVQLTVDDGLGCSRSTTQQITVNPAPRVNVGADISICDNADSIPLNAISVNSSAIQWFSSGTGIIQNGTTNTAAYFLSDSDTFPNPLSIYAVVTGHPSCANDTDFFNVSFYQTPKLLSDSNKTICPGQTGTYLYANAYDGMGPYSFLWNTGSTADSIFADTGTYTLQVTDSRGCTSALDTMIIDRINVIIDINIYFDSVICDYELPKALNAIVTGATGVLWTAAGGFSPSDDSLSVAYTPSAAEISSGYFSVYAQTTGNGTCPAAYDSAHIYISNMLIASKDSVIPGCDLSNGSATITPSGTFPPFTYTWSANTGGQTDSIATNLPTDVYIVTVEDFYGCIIVDSFNLDNNQPDLQIIGLKDVVCFGDSTGTATVLASGGVPGYTYLWDTLAGSQTSATATHLSAGTYFVTVTDNINCKASTSVTIIQPTDSALPSVLQQNNLLCFGDSNGTVTLTTTGGTGTNYTYTWGTSPPQFSATAINLSAGIYFVTVFDDSLCPSIFWVEITQPTEIILNPFVVSNYNGSDISCYGASDGIVEVSASGGVGNYTYVWDDISAQTTAQANGLPNGTYTVQVSDSNACSKDTIITLLQPDSIQINMQVISDYNGENIRCFGDSNGIALASVSGGTVQYSYIWNDSNTQTDSIASNLSEGTYQVIITDANGCKDSANITLTEPTPLVLSGTFTPVSCFGYSDGTATVTASGATPPYSYQWDVSAWSQTTQTADSLFAGIYVVTVSDTNNCIQTISVNVTQPSDIVVVTVDDDTICPGSPVILTATATGGNGGFSYAWNNGTAFGPVLVVVPSFTTNYTVVATDIKGCTSAADTAIIYVRTFIADSISMIKGQDICEGESTFISSTYQSTLGPYTYIWSNGETGSGPHLVSPSDTTTYFVTITDLCFNNIVGSIQVNVFPLPIITQNLVPLVGCQPFSVSLADSSFNEDIAQYIWNISNGTTINGNPFEYVFENTGDYAVLLSMISNKGCTAVFDTAQIIKVNPKPEVTCGASPLTTDHENALIKFTSSTHNNYFWDFGVSDLTDDTSNVSPTEYFYPDTGTYLPMLIVYNEFMCADSCIQIIRIDPKIKISVPNVFIPNPNGSNGGTYDVNNLTNEVFFAKLDYVEDFHMMIFNRWGELVFESFDVNIGWDGYYRGKLCQQDVYVWKIKARFADGNTRDFTGDLTLLR